MAEQQSIGCLDLPGAPPKPASAPPRPCPLWLKAVVFALAYFLCAEAGAYLSVPNSAYLSFWLPGGLFVGVLLLTEPREWFWLCHAVMPANFLFDFLRGTPFWVLVVFYLANVLKSVSGAWMVRRFVSKQPTLCTLKEFAGVLFFAAVLSSMAGAAMGAATVVVAGLSDSFLESWKIWWGSTGMAVLIVTPFLLAWFSNIGKSRVLIERPRRMLEAACLAAGLALCTMEMLVFGEGINSPTKSRLLLFLLWAGLRFGLRGATSAILFLALLTGLFTTQFHKGLSAAELSAGDYVFTMQTFLAVAALVGLVPAIVLHERDTTLEELRKSEEKFAKAFRASPTGVLLTEIATGRYIEVNESFCRLYGYTQAETVGKSSLELGIFDSPDERAKLIVPLREKGLVRDVQLRTRARNGDLKVVLVNAELIKLDDKQCLLSVIYDITARLQVEARLAESQKQLRALVSRRESLREEERTHLAREIHDHLGQLLTALKLDLRLLERKMAGVAVEAELRAALDGKLASATQLVDETITSVQKIASELRPAILDRLGLEAAIEVETRAFQSRTRLECECVLPERPVGLAPERATAVFRIFQELLTNVARHAQATRVAVQLSRLDGRAVLEVKDDGKGMKEGDLENPKSLGLLGMKERAEILGGNIVFSASGGKGTTVRLEIPVEKAGG